jgi:hypothetical protein
MENRLSQQQEDFLGWLLDRYRDREVPGRLTEYGKHSLEHWGVHLPRFENGTSRSECASFSRAIRRLEQRGLVQRRNSHSGDKYQDHYENERQFRTVEVRFTPAGRELAERSTEEKRPELTSGAGI